MNKNKNFETYLIISPNYFLISVIQKENIELVYSDKKVHDISLSTISLEFLDEFLKKNIFKIEKKIGNFLNNIFLIVDYDNFFSVKISIKKNYSGDLIKLESLKYLLHEIKKDCNKTILGKKIIHMVIDNYCIDEKNYSTLPENVMCDSLCLDVNLLCLPREYIENLESVLKKYHILISKIFSANYMKSLFSQNEHDLIKMVVKVKNGYNANEVFLVDKKLQNKGFFEKFFDIFR